MQVDCIQECFDYHWILGLKRGGDDNSDQVSTSAGRPCLNPCSQPFQENTLKYLASEKNVITTPWRELPQFDVLSKILRKEFEKSLPSVPEDPAVG